MFVWYMVSGVAFLFAAVGFIAVGWSLRGWADRADAQDELNELERETNRAARMHTWAKISEK